jgi:hypothetical protein
MGKRRRHTLQGSMWRRLRTCRARPHIRSNTRLNLILDERDFDGYVERCCRRFYADDGRPGLPPVRYFRLLLIGYFARRAGCRGGSPLSWALFRRWLDLSGILLHLICGPYDTSHPFETSCAIVKSPSCNIRVRELISEA